MTPAATGRREQRIGLSANGAATNDHRTLAAGDDPVVGEEFLGRAVSADDVDGGCRWLHEEIAAPVQSPVIVDHKTDHTILSLICMDEDTATGIHTDTADAHPVDAGTPVRPGFANSHPRLAHVQLEIHDASLEELVEDCRERRADSDCLALPSSGSFSGSTNYGPG